MTTLVDVALAAGFAAQDALAGETVTLIRGAASNTATAVPGRTLTTRISEEGTQTNQHIRDWLIAADQYDPLATGPVEPRQGDELTRTVGTTTERYEVFTPDGFDEPYRFSDRGRTRYRIHTRQIPAA